jgi:chromosome partitioning protein
MIREILDHEIEIALVVPTFYDRRNRKSREILDTLESHFDGKVTRPVRINVRLAEAASHHQTIYEYAPGSHGARDYEDLTEQLIGGRKNGR